MGKTMSPRTKRFTLALTAVLTVLGIGIAYAFWTSTGTGTGEATTGQSVALTISSDEAVGTISPGGAGQTVEFTVTNPGPGVQSLSSVTVTMADAQGEAWLPPEGCSIDDYTASITTAPTYGVLQVDGTATGTATVTLANTGVNQDACQGATVPLRFVAA